MNELWRIADLVKQTRSEGRGHVRRRADSDYLDQHLAKVELLDRIIARAIHPEFEFFFDEQYKAASMIFNLFDPVFVLAPGQTDAGRLTETIEKLARARDALRRSHSNLKQLPQPVDQLIAATIVQQTAQIQQLTALEQYFRSQKKAWSGRRNERALAIAIGLRAAFERYSGQRLTATKTAGHVTSVFPVTLKEIFQVIEMDSDPFEPARKALAIPQDDQIYAESRAALRRCFHPETDFPYKWCETSFEYVETDQSERERSVENQLNRMIEEGLL